MRHHHDMIESILTDAIVGGIEAWKKNDEAAMQKVISNAASRIERSITNKVSSEDEE